MKKLIALVMVLGLVGFAAAQDMTGLDSAKAGVAVDQKADNGGNSSVFDMIISKMQEMEAKYIARQVSEWEWIKWGYWKGAGTNWNRNGPDYSWANRSDIHYELWEQLSPAEFAAAKAEFNASWNRILAAGLN